MRHRYLIAVTMAWFFSFGHSVQAETAKEVPWYNIELIIFAQNSANAGGNEIWPVNPGQPTELTTTYPTVPQDEWLLNREYGALKRTSGRQQPILHTAWRQPVVAKKRAQPVAINLSAQGVPLIGTIKVSVQRYLHINVDLLLGTPSSTFNSSLAATNQATYTQLPDQYRFIAHRKMRSEELHYIDHPKLGIIVKATKYIAPEVVPEATAAVEATPEKLPAEPKVLAPN